MTESPVALGLESLAIGLGAAVASANGTLRIEEATFTKAQSGSATCWDIERQGSGAFIVVETLADGWRIQAVTDPASERAQWFAPLNERGLIGWHSGGGCRAMHRECGEDGFYILATDSDADFPAADDWIVSLNDGANFSGDCIAYETGEGGAALLEAIDRLAAQGEAMAAKRSAMLDRRAIVLTEDKARGPSQFTMPTIRGALAFYLDDRDGVGGPYFPDSDGEGTRLYLEEALAAFDHDSRLEFYDSEGDRYTIAADLSA